jgi:hypothetical protein
MYGEFTCQTCHEKRSINAAGIKSSIMGRPVIFKGATGPYSFGDDSVDKPDPQGTYRICEVCHTQTSATTDWFFDGSTWVPSYAPAHRNDSTQKGNHANSNGQDCTHCHSHDNGFAAGPYQQF